MIHIYIYDTYDHLPKAMLGEPSSFFVCNYNCCIKTWPGSKDPVLPAFQVGEWGATGQAGNQFFKYFWSVCLRGTAMIYIYIYIYKHLYICNERSYN